ncbi:MAG: hypothetical protein A2Z83_06270 [Omnitrophica bacterium GWA2_52_8]|nr:MAG: hypothetical protein A2Z83_06270 [Omnitrophica bacterium GWA2_52_8]
MYHGRTDKRKLVRAGRRLPVLCLNFMNFVELSPEYIPSTPESRNLRGNTGPLVLDRLMPVSGWLEGCGLTGLRFHAE